MENKLQFQQNANVITSSGHPIGRIDRVVINPDTKVLSHIVVRKGSIFKKEDKVVPVELVKDTTTEKIELRDEAGDLQSFPPLEEKHLVRSGENVNGGLSSVVNPSTRMLRTPMAGTPAPMAPIQKFVTHIDLNIPEGTVALKAGAKVMTLEGTKVGTVERVEVEAPSEKATHLVVASGVMNRVKKLIPIQWVMMMGEKEVHLDLKRHAVKNLGGNDRR